MTEALPSPTNPISERILAATSFIAVPGNPLDMFKGIEVLEDLPRAVGVDMVPRIEGAFNNALHNTHNVRQDIIRLGAGLVIAHAVEVQPEGENLIKLYIEGIKRHAGRHRTGGQRSLGVKALASIEYTGKIDALLHSFRPNHARWLEKYGHAAGLGINPITWIDIRTTHAVSHLWDWVSYHAAGLRQE